MAYGLWLMAYDQATRTTQFSAALSFAHRSPPDVSVLRAAHESSVCQIVTGSDQLKTMWSPSTNVWHGSGSSIDGVVCRGMPIPSHNHGAIAGGHWQLVVRRLTTVEVGMHHLLRCAGSNIGIFARRPWRPGPARHNAMLGFSRQRLYRRGLEKSCSVD